MRKRLVRTVFAVFVLSVALVVLRAQADDPAPNTAPAVSSNDSSARRVPSPADVLTAEKPAAALPALGQKVYIIPIHGEINDVTAAFIKRGVEEAAAGGATAIVFDLETPGGGVMSAMDICSTIKTQPVHTVAWVHSHAYSAGALISMACKQIVVAPHSAIGDCAPIAVSITHELVPLPDTERDKIASPIRAEFRESAHANGYPLSLSLAMVSTGPAIYRIKDSTSGAVRYVLATELASYGLSERGATIDPQPATAPPTTAAPSAAAASWTIDKKVLEERQLLTMHAAEAMEFGFAKAYVADETELMQFLRGDKANLHRIEPTWSEHLVPWLTSMPVRAVLLIVFLIAMFIELSVPGLSGAGLVAVIALSILLGAPYLTGLAGVMDILLVLLGIVLIAVELFVLPGHLAFGITGIALVFLGLVMTFVPKESGPQWLPQTSGGWSAMETGALTVLASITVAMIGMIFLSRYLPSVPIFGRLVLQSTGPGEPLPAGADAPMQTTGADGAGQSIRVGAIGRVTTGLRPVGRAEFEDQLTDVVTRGEWIEAGGRIRIVALEGNNVIVEEA